MVCSSQQVVELQKVNLAVLRQGTRLCCALTSWCSLSLYTYWKPTRDVCRQARQRKPAGEQVSNASAYDL